MLHEQFLFFLRLLRKVRVNNTIFFVPSIVVRVVIEKEILTDLNSAKVEMFIYK